MPPLYSLSAVELVDRLRTGKLSAVELMSETLERISIYNPRINAIVAMRPGDDLRAEAAAADALRASGAPLGALHGLPIAVKDTAEVAGIPWTNGSPIFATRVTETDCIMAARLKAAGAIIIGKTNVPEFAMGSNTYNPVYGITRNPYDLQKTPGGSSGGAAAALAARLVALADGSDMMGSCRNPAAFCNVYGIRPSVGLMPDPSISAGELRISTIGCLARSVTDIALLLDVQAGAHPHDADSFGPERPFSEAVLSPPQSPRVAWLSDFGGAYAYEAGIPPLCEAAMRLMASKLNAIITPLTPTTPAASLWTAWTTLRSQKMAANYNALYDDPQKRALLKPEAVWEIEMGRALSENDVAHAKALRNEWLDEAARIFASHDFFLLPSAQVFPFDVSQAYPKSIGGTQMDTYHRWMEVSIPASLLGLPALAVPCGQAHGQHMGMQIVAKHGADGALLAFGRAYESAFAEAASISDRAPPPGFGIDEI